MQLKNKVALVTGASSGIGKAIAYELLKRGAFCAIASRNQQVLESMAGEWIKENENYRERLCVIPLDVTREDQCRQAVEQVVARWGRLEILVNNAGYGVYGPIEKTSSEVAKALFDTNFFGTCSVTRAALSHIKKSKESYIVMISSVAGKIAVPWMGYYCASKFAMNAFADSLRPELLPYGTQVLTVMPGPVKTAFRENARSVTGINFAPSFFGGEGPSSLRDSAGPGPLGRGRGAEEIAIATCDAMEKNKREIVPGFGNKVNIFLRKNFMALSDRLLARILGPW